MLSLGFQWPGSTAGSGAASSALAPSATRSSPRSNTFKAILGILKLLEPGRNCEDACPQKQSYGSSVCGPTDRASEDFRESPGSSSRSGAASSAPASSATRSSPRSSSSSSPSLSSLEMSDTKVYEPEIRALLGTASHFCVVGVLTQVCAH